MPQQVLLAAACLALGVGDVVYIGVAAAPAAMAGASSVTAEAEAVPAPLPAPEPRTVAVADNVDVNVNDHDVGVTVRFGVDRATLGPQARGALDEVARSVVGRIAVEGHADEVGDSEHNDELSRRRAERVADYLEAHGVARERMEVRAFGESRPLGGELGLNRRVEIHTEEDTR